MKFNVVIPIPNFLGIFKLQKYFLKVAKLIVTLTECLLEKQR